MSDQFDRLDVILPQLVSALDAPGQDDGSAESTWQRLDLLYASMGADALRAMLRRQGMDSAAIADALAVLDRRRIAMS